MTLGTAKMDYTRYVGSRSRARFSTARTQVWSHTSKGLVDECRDQAGLAGKPHRRARVDEQNGLVLFVAVRHSTCNWRNSLLRGLRIFSALPDILDASVIHLWAPE